MKIYTTIGLAEAIGSYHPTIESVSRAIYKGTDCGAWVDERQIGTQHKTRFKVIFSASILGIVAHQWQQNGRGTWRGFGEAITPMELKQFLGGYEPKMVGASQHDWEKLLQVDTEHKSLAELRKATADNDAIVWLPRKQNTCWITLNVTRYKPGIGVGSIVEGIDQCTETYELAYPFSDKQFWKAVQAVEDEARDLWLETHACPDCAGYGENEETEGTGPIDPDCPTCHGQGDII